MKKVKFLALVLSVIALGTVGAVAAGDQPIAQSMLPAPQVEPFCPACPPCPPICPVLR